MDDIRARPHGKGVNIGDRQVPHRRHARHDPQPHHDRRRPVSPHHLLTEAQRARPREAPVGSQPRMAGCRLHRLVGRGRGLRRWLVVLALGRRAAGRRRAQRHIQQVAVVVDEDVLHRLRGDGVRTGIIRHHLRADH